MTTVVDPVTVPPDGSDPDDSNSPGGPRPLAVRLWRGPAGDPAWARPALLALLVATAALYLWSLSASGWANAFYSAAVQAGTKSWKAFFFGSFDAANAITVDKTPASLWVMELSARIFGLSSWSLLAPQALEGVATVAVVYAAVRRWFGPAAGLLAGAVLAVTPVATLMFRFNNPDALLTLLLAVGAYAVVRALEKAGTGWLVLAGAAVGFGFLTKMLQALLVVPAFALAYLFAAPTSVRRRLGQLLLAGLSLVVAAGWWVAVVELIPASSRPYIGGSQNNSVLELALGYNGLGRLTGDETGSVGPTQWGETGWMRLFNAELGGQVAWLLPAALLLLLAGLAVTLRAPRTDRTRAAFLLWGGWLVVTGVTFSLMKGIFHPYYTVALAPAIGAVVGMGAAVLWRARRSALAGAYAAAVVGVTAVWSYTLLGRSPDWHPQLRTVVLVAGIAAALLILVRAAAVLAASRADRPAPAGEAPARPAALGTRLLRGTGRLGPLALGLAVVAALAGPLGYSLQTAGSGHTGAIPSAGPAVRGGFGPGGGPGGFRRPGRGGGTGGFPGGNGGFPAPPGGNIRNGGNTQNGPGQNGNGAQGGVFRGPNGTGGAPGGFGSPGGGGGPGGLLDTRTPSSQIVSTLRGNAGAYTWVAAGIGSMNASGYQLATGEPVMAIGGFNGSDPSPTLAQFQEYVRAGKIHYFIGGGGFRANGGSASSQQISSWVAQTFTATTVDGVTLYDLTKPNV